MANESTKHALVAWPTRAFSLRGLLLRVVGVAVVLVVCLPTWMAFGARWFWLAELACHFVLPNCWLLPVVLVGCWLAKKQWLTWLAAVSLAVNLFRLGWFWLPVGVVASAEAPAKQADASAVAAPFRVLTQNVLKVNRQKQAVVRLIERERPDLFVLFEVNPLWVDAMSPLATDYPYSGQQILGTRSGVFVASRLPLAELRFEKLGPINRYTAIAEVAVGERRVTVFGMHPSLPKRPKNVGWRNAELLAAAQRVAETPGPVVLMGDLNTTPWSPVFGDVLRLGGLRNSMQGWGVQPTWSLKGRWPLMLPIDHVLHTPGLRVIDRRVGADVGSDHRAVIVDYAVASEEAP